MALVRISKKRWVFHKRTELEYVRLFFGEEGLVNADDSISFDKMSKDVHFGAFRFFSVHFGSFRFISVHFGSFRFISVHFGSFR